MAPTALAIPDRFRSLQDDPRLTVRLDGDGYAHRIAQKIRLFEGPDLYSAKQPRYEVWGAGVSKLVAALGFTVTPMVLAPNPEGIASSHGMKTRPGQRILSDPQSGVPIRIEQDVRLTGRHPGNGTWIDIIATGQIDLHHLLVQALAKIQTEEVVRLVTDRVKVRMDGQAEFDTWAFYPYGPGTWVAANLTKAGVRDVLSAHREQARTDKALGFATSKAIRLALKQANVLPMAFVSGQLRQDWRGQNGERVKVGPAYIDLLVSSWVVCESRTSLQQSIDAILAKSTDTIDATWHTVAGDNDNESADEAGLLDDDGGDPLLLAAPVEDLAAKAAELAPKPELVKVAPVEEPANPATKRAATAPVEEPTPRPIPTQRGLTARLTPAERARQTLVRLEKAHPEQARQGRMELRLGDAEVKDLDDGEVDQLLSFMA